MTQSPEPTETNQGLTGRKLSEAERTEAVKALRNWFIQNDINAQEGGIVMIELLAACLVDKTTDLLKLQDSVETYRLALVYSIALALIAKRKATP